jgi:DNA-binding CsgD family transcriptional regulator/HD-like signal output (HDOD) protein
MTDPPSLLRGRADASDPPQSDARHRGIGRFLTTFEQLPAFGFACDRALVAARTDPKVGFSDLITAIESDTGLTVAILRSAQDAAGRCPIGNVPDAVAELGRDAIRKVIEAVPRAAFPWQTAKEALIHDLRVHSQLVAQAADRIAEEVSFRDRDDLICAALVHDVGKLVMALALGDADRCPDARTATPEQRVRHERRELLLDHASLGTLLAERWAISDRISGAIAGHHSSESHEDLASLLRLADLVARFAHGDAVDRQIMVRLAATWGFPVPALRELLFELPQPRRRRCRSEPSPLSGRETDALRQLATGKIYKEIAAELGVATSTIRTHLQSVYVKLDVADRAQAVLRATEKGWI